MKRLVALAVAATVVLAGCGDSSPEAELAELAERRDECNDLGGVFEKYGVNVWTHHPVYHCNFDQSEDTP